MFFHDVTMIKVRTLKGPGFRSMLAAAVPRTYLVTRDFVRSSNDDVLFFGWRTPERRVLFTQYTFVTLCGMRSTLGGVLHIHIRSCDDVFPQNRRT